MNSQVHLFLSRRNRSYPYTKSTHRSRKERAASEHSKEMQIFRTAFGLAFVSVLGIFHFFQIYFRSVWKIFYKPFVYKLNVTLENLLFFTVCDTILFIEEINNICVKS